MSLLNKTSLDEKERRDPGFFCRSGQPRFMPFHMPVIKEAWIEARTPEDAELLLMMFELMKDGFTLEHAAEVVPEIIESKKRLKDMSFVDIMVEWYSGRPRHRDSDQDGRWTVSPDAQTEEQADLQWR